MAVIDSLKGSVFNLKGEVVDINFFSNSFGSSMFFLQIKLVPALLFSIGTANIAMEYSRPSFF